VSEKHLSLSSDHSLLEMYNDMPIAKAIVQLIPGIGTFINEILSNKGGKIKEQRLESFLNALYECIRIVDQSTIKKEWVQSEEFYDLLNAAIESSLKTRSKEKLYINAMIITNSLILENKDRFMPEEYLSAISDLTPLELKALVVIYKEFESAKRLPEQNDLQFSKSVNWKESLKNKCELSDEDFIFLMKRLERTGFVKEITGMYFDYEGGEFMITPSFGKFIEYLSTNKKQLID
jgi:hypothetical protein